MIYNNLYKLILKDTNSATIVLSDKGHPVFRAHFPSNPILPGFIHFDIVSDIFSMNIQSIRYEKNDNKLKVFCEEEVVASFSI